METFIIPQKKTSWNINLPGREKNCCLPRAHHDASRSIQLLSIIWLATLIFQAFRRRQRLESSFARRSKEWESECRSDLMHAHSALLSLPFAYSLMRKNPLKLLGKMFKRLKIIHSWVLTMLQHTAEVCVSPAQLAMTDSTTWKWVKLDAFFSSSTPFQFQRESPGEIDTRCCHVSEFGGGGKKKNLVEKWRWMEWKNEQEGKS